MKTATCGILLSLTTLALQQDAAGSQAHSDGSKGPFNPGSNITIDLATEATNGVLNYTTINIPAHVTVRFSPNASNTPVFLAATGDVVIAGTIDISAPSLNPGGYSGGTPGDGSVASTDGLGPGGGERGHPYSGAGGGAGMASNGLHATDLTGANYGEGGLMVPRPNLTQGISGGGGSGGGGGSVGYSLGGIAMAGGDGGTGAGALQISTPGLLQISGTLKASGSTGGIGSATAFGHGGPGGGGAGGTIELYSTTLEITSNAVISAKGGKGGTIDTRPIWYSSGADGSIGYLTLVAEHYQISPDANIHDIAMQPAGFPLSLSVVSSSQYQLQCTETLVSNDWRNIGPIQTPASGTTNISFTDISMAGTSNRFYRLVEIPVE
ncbi:hypothetical protein P4B35_13680 [Pontiellaceae bacterium B12227]|nr:hypothetical protein [Pontiellaceae bacterium B12227]